MVAACNPYGFIVVFAVDDQSTLEKSEEILSYLQMTGTMQDKAVILVANKTDKVKSRVVKTAGKLQYKII